MNRRDLLKTGVGAMAARLVSTASAETSGIARKERVERWGVFEFETSGPKDGNPFVEVQFGARFSPDEAGAWMFETTSNVAELRGKAGGFECVAPAEGNRGPVGTARQFH